MKIVVINFSISVICRVFCFLFRYLVCVFLGTVCCWATGPLLGPPRKVHAHFDWIQPCSACKVLYYTCLIMSSCCCLFLCLFVCLFGSYQRKVTISNWNKTFYDGIVKIEIPIGVILLKSLLKLCSCVKNGGSF